MSEMSNVLALFNKWGDLYPKLVGYHKMAQIGRVLYFSEKKKDEKKEKKDDDKPTFKSWLMLKFALKRGHVAQFAAAWRNDAKTVETDTAGVDWDWGVREKIEYSKGVALMKKLLLWQLVTGDPKWKYCIFHLSQVLKYDYVKKHGNGTDYLMFSKQVDPYYTDRGVRWNYKLADIDMMVARMNKFVKYGNWADGFCTMLD